MHTATATNTDIRHHMSFSAFTLAHGVFCLLFWYLFLTEVNLHVYATRTTGLAYVLKMDDPYLYLLQLIALLGLIFTKEQHMTLTRVLLNTLAPYGLFFVLELSGRLPVFVWAPLLFSAVSLVFDAGHIFFCERGALFSFTKLRAMLYVAIPTACTVLTVVCLLCAGLTFTSVATLTDPAGAQGKSVAVPDPVSIPVPPLSVGEAIELLCSESRKEISLERLQEACQTIADTEQAYWGYPIRNRVVVTELPENTLGRFSTQQHVIQINKEYLLNGSAERIVNNVLHECHHAAAAAYADAIESLDPDYQNLLFLKTGVAFSKGFDSYVPGSEDYERYYNNPVEIAARNYAKHRTPAYFE